MISNERFQTFTANAMKKKHRENHEFYFINHPSETYLYHRNDENRKRKRRRRKKTRK